MDLTKIDDIDKLKSLAFDAIQAIEVQQHNLRMIQSRLLEVEESNKKPVTDK
jgi:hypothetical protein